MLQDGRTALYWSAFHGHVEAFRVLLAAGANPAIVRKIYSVCLPDLTQERGIFGCCYVVFLRLTSCLAEIYVGPTQVPAYEGHVYGSATLHKILRRDLPPSTTPPLSCPRRWTPIYYIARLNRATLT